MLIRTTATILACLALSSCVKVPESSVDDVVDAANGLPDGGAPDAGQSSDGGATADSSAADASGPADAEPVDMCGEACIPRSCRDHLRLDPEAQDGDYEVFDEDGQAVTVTCDMMNGGWTRVYVLEDACPTGWDPHPSVVGCGRGETDDRVRIASFPVPHRFGEVRILARGVMESTVDAFNPGGGDPMPDGNYVDGLGLFLSSADGQPHDHLWTYAASFSETANALQGPICPCKGGRAAPDFVGENYVCESGFAGNGTDWPSGWYEDDVLWDESECHPESAPYVEVALPADRDGAIEARFLIDSTRGDEDLVIRDLELWVRPLE